MNKIILILCLSLIAQPLFPMVVPSSSVECDSNIKEYSGGYTYAPGHKPQGMSPVTKQATFFWVTVILAGVILVGSIT